MDHTVDVQGIPPHRLGPGSARRRGSHAILGLRRMDPVVQFLASLISILAVKMDGGPGGLAVIGGVHVDADEEMVSPVMGQGRTVFEIQNHIRRPGHLHPGTQGREILPELVGIVQVELGLGRLLIGAAVTRIQQDIYPFQRLG